MKGPFVAKRMFPYQPEGPMLFYIWHKDAKKKKFPIIQINTSYYVAGDGTLYLKSEYEPCDPPAPEREWVDVTNDLVLSRANPAFALIDGRNAVVALSDTEARRLQLVDAYKVSDFPLPASCLHVPFQRMLVLIENRPVQS